MNSDSTQNEPDLHVSDAVRTETSARITRFVEPALLLVAAVFFALHFVHLRADFPNRSPWMDWAKYTDEGWYGDAAIRHYQLGHWNVPGDFNPAAALPVWPLLEMALFRVTGVSLVAARVLTVVVFGGILLASFMLLRRWRCVSVERPLAPAVAVLLLAASPFLYAFSRLAILEPLLILLTLTALLTASEAGMAAVELPAAGAAWPSAMRAMRWAVALGLLLPLTVLTKTTGVFLFPAVFWMLWAATGFQARATLRALLIACSVGGGSWAAYYVLFVRRHYLLDYRYLFSANAYTGITRTTFWPVLHDALMDGAWMGGTLFVLALMAAVAAAIRLCSHGLRGLPGLRAVERSNGLNGALLLWVFGYAAFLIYHANLQPRYYLVLAVPLMLLAAAGLDALRGWCSVQRGALLPRLALWVGGAALAFAAVRGAQQTISFVLHPEYSWVAAAEQVREAIGRQPTVKPLLLSISGSEISLLTGVPSICDDFGTMTLAERAATYQPGWFATWNDVEDDKMEALAPMYRLVRVMAVPAFDDPERNLLILYRLDPLGAAAAPGRRRRLSVPHRLRTKVGEQPSVKQLEH